MRVLGTLNQLFVHQREMLTLVILFLCISPSLGNDKPPDCGAQDPEFCSSPCTYLRDRCNGNRECLLGLCSYLYPQTFCRHPEGFLELLSDCVNESRFRSKRAYLNKNIAYLLLKLHPFLNQTSQFGFLTSGRFRRITGSYGTEFLGKRSNNKDAASGGENQNLRNTKATSTSLFYSLPLDKFAKLKILKKRENLPLELSDFREKRLSIRRNDKVVLGSEFLGKRGYSDNDRIKRLTGNEFLGKRNGDSLDGSELLGKRMLVSQSLSEDKDSLNFHITVFT